VNAGQTFTNACPTPTIFGCGVNPTGSLTVISGEPRLGQDVVLGLDNPLGTQPAFSVPFLAVSADPDLNYPCGTVIPGWGMGGSGELLISMVPPEPTVLLVGPVWIGAGNPAPITLSVPNMPALVGQTYYGQGLIYDPSVTFGVKFGLTDAVELPIGS